MNDNDNRAHQMFIRSREFMAQSINDFTAGGAAHQYYTNLQDGITTFEQQAAAHGTGLSDARQGTQERSDTREELTRDLELIRSAARAMGVLDQFPRPPQNDDERLLQLTDVYVAQAAPLKTQLIAHELPSDFLEDLAADKSALQAAVAEQANSRGDHIAARAELDEARDSCLAAVRQLDGPVRIRYAGNPGKLAEWTAASHLERAPRRAKPEPPPATTPPRDRSPGQKPVGAEPVGAEPVGAVPRDSTPGQ